MGRRRARKANSMDTKQAGKLGGLKGGKSRSPAKIAAAKANAAKAREARARKRREAEE